MSDLINREAAIKHLYGRLIESANNNVGVWEDAGIVFEGIATERLKTWVYEIPTAEKVGKWIEFDSAEDKYDVIKCPFCKHIFTVDSYHWSDIGFVKDDFKFCPNCGARMEGEAVRRTDDDPSHPFADGVMMKE